MKLSIKIMLLGVLIPVLALIISILILSTKTTEDHDYRLVNSPNLLFKNIEENMSPSALNLDINTQDSRVLNISDFESVELIGTWSVDIDRDSNEGAFLQGSSESLKSLEVIEDGNRIIIKSSSSSKDSVISGTIRAEKVKNITIDGIGTVNLNGFKSIESLYISAKGMITLNAYDFYIRNLKLNLDGAVNCLFTDGEINNLNLDYKGIGSMDMNFKKGVLIGRTEGICKINITGEVKSNKIIISDGLGQINIK